MAHGNAWHVRLSRQWFSLSLPSHLHKAKWLWEWDMKVYVLFFCCKGGIKFDENNCAFIITFNTKEAMSNIWRQKILTFSNLSPDILASWAAVPSTMVIGVYDLVWSSVIEEVLQKLLRFGDIYSASTMTCQTYSFLCSDQDGRFHVSLVLQNVHK